MSKQLAIMTAPKFGMRDIGQPGFWFDVSYGENLSYAALIVLSTERMVQAVTDTDVYDISSLDGSPCQIDETDNIVRFIKLLKR